jgi:hypothetical protein
MNSALSPEPASHPWPAARRPFSPTLSEGAAAALFENDEEGHGTVKTDGPIPFVLAGTVRLALPRGPDARTC